MTLPNDRPYSQFNFLIVLGTGARAAEAGFQEVTGLGMDVQLGEHRTSGGREKHLSKVLGAIKLTDLTLKRGVTTGPALEQWMRDLRDGRPEARQVMIQLQNEDRSAIAATWKVIGARIVKHTSGPLNASGTDVAMEELVLGYERLEIE